MRFLLCQIALLTHACGGAGKPDLCPALIAGREWVPLRIKVLLGATDAITPDQLATLTTELLPRAVAFWEKSMRIRPTGSPFRAHKIEKKCGHTVLSKNLLKSIDGFTNSAGSLFSGNGSATVDSGPANFVLFVTATKPLRGRGMSYAYGCPGAMDECGRPSIGHVNVNAKAFDGYYNTDKLIAMILHEMAHTLGFVANFADWRLPDGTRRIKAPKTLKYHTRRDRSGFAPARLGFSWKPFTIDYVYTYPTGIVESIATRGFGSGSTCRCPIDPNKKYTNDDLADCMGNPGNCAFAITTPKVKAAAREFFDCDSLEGMEFENQLANLQFIINPHWKVRLVHGEFLNFGLSVSTDYVSPMTFAFFEDSGWYQMDYSMTSTPVRGVTWGYKQGCAFVQQKCISDETGEAQRPSTFPDAFCALTAPQCSPDGKGVGQCRSWASYPAPTLSQYRYNASVERRGPRAFDSCPVFLTFTNDWAPHPTDRCLMKEAWSSEPAANGSSVGPEPFIATVRCLPGGGSAGQESSYEVFTDGTVRGVCTEAGQILTYSAETGAGTEMITCSSPALICAQFRYPHLPASSQANQNMDGIGESDLPLEGTPFVLNISPIKQKGRKKWHILATPTPTMV